MSDASPTDEGLPLDLAVVRALARLTDGDIASFRDTTEPPPEVVGWIGCADRAGINGVLIHALRRWCELAEKRGIDG
ncbi:MAG: hypothetical protein AAF266_08010 [Planctomycetota bacterium]